MSLSIGSQQVTDDGAIGTSGKKIRLYGLIVHSGETAAVVVVRNGTSTSGTEYDEINGTISVSVRVNYPGGLQFPGGLFIDVDANTTYVTAIYEQESS